MDRADTADRAGSPGDAASAVRLLARTLVGLTLLAVGPALAAVRMPAALLPLGALLLPLSGVAAALAVSRARRAVAAFAAEPQWIARVVRRQVVVVPVAAAAALCAGLAPIAAGAPVWVLGVAMVAAFGLLLAERHVAALPTTALPEAPALARLMVAGIAGVVAPALLAVLPPGFPAVATAGWVLRGGVILLAGELAVRAAVRRVLPGAPRAVVDSTLLTLRRSVAREGVAGSLRDHFGLDFSRSWALAYARTATAPLLGVLLAGVWLLTGVVVVPADRRAVAERYGAPVGVLRPGLHLIAPWPIGRAVMVEFGTVHEVPLGGRAAVAETVAADAVPPPGADRLWEQSHPAELQFLVASAWSTGTTGVDGAQGFQVVSADIRTLYRLGLEEDAARRFVATTAEADALVRSATARATAAALSHRTIDLVLGERHQQLAKQLRSAAQAELDSLGTGLEVLAVVTEAIHPPAGAADAYHGVQAAEIQARTTIATERGRAQATLAMARQGATTAVAQAAGSAAERRQEAATAELRFAADRGAAAAGGRAFLSERYYEALVGALAGTPKTIVDARLGPAGAAIDLRPLVPGSPAARED